MEDSLNSTVWIVNDAGHDYKAAEKYGRLQPLTIGDVNPFQVDRLLYNLSNGIGKFARADDFLLLSGTPILPALTLSLWLTRFDKCQLLLWDARERDYRVSTVTKANLVSILEKAMAT